MAGKAYPKKDSRETGQGKTKAVWKGYVNWSLDRVDKKKFKEWSEGRDVFDDLVPSILDGGYKLSLSYDAYNQSCVGSLYCHDPAGENAGWCLTARAAVPYECLLRVLYLHYVCFQEVWPGDYDPALDGWQ